MDLNLNEQAKKILIDNDRNGYTVPTRGLYPFQWNWDSAFCSLGWFLFDKKRAFREIEALLSGQWENGMVPHIIFHKENRNYFPGPEVWDTGQKIPTSGYSQPPVLASFLKKMVELSPEKNVLEKVRDFIPAVMKWHTWFWRERNPDNNGLICVLHPWESGRDNLPDWDSGMREVDYSKVGKFKRKDTEHVDCDSRPLEEDYKKYLALVNIGKETGWNSFEMMEKQPFIMIDVFMTAVLLRANLDLLELTVQLNMPGEAAEIEKWIEKTSRNFDSLWNPEVEAYTTFDYVKKQSVKHITSANFMALYAHAADDSKKAILNKTFDRWAEKVKYTVPSFDPESPLFEEKRYWRGPTWLQINYLLKQAFGETGGNAQAKRIAEDSKALIRQSSFSEYYSPLTGKAHGGQYFSWSASVWLAEFSPTKI